MYYFVLYSSRRVKPFEAYEIGAIQIERKAGREAGTY